MRTGLLALALLLVAACGSSNPPPNRTAGGPTCKSMQADATSALSKTVEDNRACTQDSDCVTVAFGASCFDACTRAIATSGKEAYDAAVSSVNAGACAAYQEHACPAHVVPPCAPPQPPACRAGVCE